MDKRQKAAMAAFFVDERDYASPYHQKIKL